MDNIVVEVCAGSLEDCLNAEKAGADRIELNQAVHMGGLTPSYGLVKKVKEQCQLPIIAMIRPRGAGFYYSEEEIEVMYEDAKMLLSLGVEGLAFGFLTSEREVDKTLTKKFTDLCHAHNAEAVFHRAFDRSADPYKAIECLIDLKVDRILTSGQKPNAVAGISLLKSLQTCYSNRIELCVGAGVNTENVTQIIQMTNIKQVHASFKSWKDDPTTHGNQVSYQYSEHGDFDYSDPDKIKALIEMIK